VSRSTRQEPLTIHGPPATPIVDLNAANAACQRGYALLEQARRQRTHAPRLLEQAAEAFSAALRQQPEQARACLGLGYLFLLVDQPQQALQFLHQARRLEPLNPEARLWIQQAERALSPYHSPHSRHERETEPVEQTLHDLIHAFSQAPVPQPVCEPLALASLQQQVQQLQHQLDHLNTQLDQLESEHDTLGWRQQLRPLEERLHQFRGVIQTSEALRETAEQIRAGRQQVAELRQAGLARARFERELEALLDRCDALADRLDAFEADGHEIQVLLAPYELLLQEVGQLQELLDEWNL
jgi:chromosome segregation ATPase